MVSEVEDTTASMTAGGQMPGQMGQGQAGGVGGTAQVMPGQGAPQQSMRNVSRDRWGDIYANMPVKRMIALYDYDPQELSPNVDAEVSPGYFILIILSYVLYFDCLLKRRESQAGSGLMGGIFGSLGFTHHVVPPMAQEVIKN